MALGKSSLHAICDMSLGIPLQSVPDPRSSSEDEAGNPWILSSVYMDLGVPMEFLQRSQASSHVETCKSAILLRWISTVMLL